MDSTHIGLDAGRSALPELAARAHAGQCSVLTRHGKPYAAIVPVDWLQRQAGRRSFLALRGSGGGLWTRQPAAGVARLRDEWA